MSNVIPPDIQKGNWRRERARFISAAAIVVVLASAAATLALVPSYLTIRANDAADEANVAAEDADRNDLANAQSLVSLIGPLLAATSSPSKAVAAAIADRPSGVRIKHISYAKSQESSLVIVGEGDGRNAINAYKQALSEDPLFASVSVPVNDLLSPEGGTFTATLTGIF